MVKISMLSFKLGLNSPIKRTRVLDLLHRKKVDVVFLQETHLTAIDAKRLQNRHYTPRVSSSCISKKKGEIILFKRNSNFIIEHTGSDENGRIAYSCTSIEGKRLGFVNIYAPNSFFPNVSKIILSLQGFSIIIGSDMTAVFDTDLDCSNPSVSVAQTRSSTALRSLIKDIDVCDALRIHNPTARNTPISPQVINHFQKLIIFYFHLRDFQG